MKKELVYVTGHQHPDTDSVASAIAYAFFKRAQGIASVPCRLGKLNAETRYLLNRFSFPEPMLLSDARVSIGEVPMDPPDTVPETTTVFEALERMQTENRTYCGVADGEGHLVGMLTKSDISVIGLYDTVRSIETLSHTPVENFRKTLAGRTIYESPQSKLNGNVSMIAMTHPENLDNYKVEGRIVICGDQPETQMKMIEKGAGMLIVVWAGEIASEVLCAARAHNCTILISGHGAMNTIRYLYFAANVTQLMKRELITFDQQELAEDVGKKMLQSRHRVYPVLDGDGRPVGYVSRYHIMQAVNKKIILVDHNEFSQSVRAIEKAQVLEVIDHHRINDFSSTSPVQFRNEIVGSTATIVATIFRENQIPIAENLAGLMLGAILSDTLNFHSPTTTQKDIATANILAALANLDIDEFAQEMFRAAGENSTLSLSEMILGDLKFFDVGRVKISISQVILPSMKDLLYQSEDIQSEIETFARKKELDLSVLAFTSILDNGSVFFFGGRRAPWGKEAFPDAPDQDLTFHGDVLSRKTQILPILTKTILRYV